MNDYIVKGMVRMKREKIKKNEFVYNVDGNNKPIKPVEVTKTWLKGYHEKRLTQISKKGLRDPQYGALNAIRAHWTVSNETATIVMPTGTGKTETMFATMLSETLKTTLIIVPSNQLRQQVFQNAQQFGILESLGIIDSTVLMPNTTILASTPSNINELKKLIDNSNIIVSTMSLLNKFEKNFKEYLSTICDALIIDEAHHITAKTWFDFKEYFINKKILQFTATPYRNDKKKLPGKIIYNYPLSLAQKQGYFESIIYHPIQEFDENEGDRSIAKKAVEILCEDIEKGHKHIILARAKTQKRAKELFDNIYNKYYSEYNPVLVVSDNSKRKNDEAIKKLQKHESKIVVGVNMFGEGIDIPTLKIAAVHDKYKTFPITVQFIGRFARSKDSVGQAKLITNIANDNLKEQVANLFQQDADWNKLLSTISEKKITTEKNIKNLLEELNKNDKSDIDIYQIQMKISTRMFNYNEKKWLFEKWKEILNTDNTTTYYSESEKLMILIEKVESKVGWSTQKDIIELDWNLFVIYHDVKNNLIHINETDQGKGNRLINVMFPTNKKIQGDTVFKSLAGVNRLMIGTLGLRNELPGKVSYRMFAGTDVAEGVANAVRGISTKSNLFGNGFNGNGKVSIGCSYKGKIWSKWVESIKYWKSWCDDISMKIKDNDISTENILKGSLKGNEITPFPNGILYNADLANDVVLEI